MKKIHQTIKYRITRKTSKYNKYMKWHIECFRSDGTILSSDYAKTQKEAKMRVSNPSKPLPIGIELLFTHYESIET